MQYGLDAKIKALTSIRTLRTILSITMPSEVKTKRKVLALSVDIEVLSADQLKKFVFGISKEKKSETQSDWTIDFIFSKRDKKADSFVDRVKVNVAVSLEAVPDVERTAMKDMTVKQRNFVNGTVANALDAFEAGEITRPQLEKLILRAASKR